MEDYYKVQAINNSILKSINPEQGGTPRKFKKYYIDKNFDEEDEDTPSLKNGRLIHKYAEDPDKFIVSDIKRPSDMMCSWVESVFTMMTFESEDSICKESLGLKTVALDRRGMRYSKMKNDTVWDKFCDEGLDYLKHLHRVDGKVVMSKQEQTIVLSCIESLHRNKLAHELLFETGDNFGDNSFNELAIYWKEEIDGVILDMKGLIDRLRVFPSQRRVELNDLKSTAKSGHLFIESFTFYRYYRQLAMYTKAIKIFLKEYYPDIDINHWRIEYNIISVETFGTYDCIVHEIPMIWIDKGMEEVSSLLSRIVYHMSNDQWELSLEEINNNGKLLMKYEN